MSTSLLVYIAILLVIALLCFEYVILQLSFNASKSLSNNSAPTILALTRSVIQYMYYTTPYLGVGN